MKLADIAKMAGVSVSTVSKVMNGSGEIGADTKARIIKIARDNNVFEKYYKGTYSKKVVAVIIAEIKSEYYSTIAAHIGELIEKNGAVAIFAESGFDEEKAAEMMEYFAFRSMVDGIITVGRAKIPKSLSVPVVAIEKYAENHEVDCINVVIDKTLEEVIKYLKECGHRKIGFIGEKLTVLKDYKFERFVRKQGLEINPEYIQISSSRFEEAGIDGMEKLLRLENPPTAVVAAYDQIAIGAIEAVKRHGRSVPEDMSVIGMTGITASAYSDIDLTTISYNTKEVCEKAVGLIMKKLENKYFRTPCNIEVESTLELRGTVKRIK